MTTLPLKKINAIISSIGETRDNYSPLWARVSQFLTPETGLFYQDYKSDYDKDLNISQYSAIVEQTPIWALKTTVAGLFNALTPPNKKWFALTAENKEQADFAKEIEAFIYEQVNSTKNESGGFYKIVPQVLRELIAYGTCCLRYQYVDKTMKYLLFTIGTYAIGQDKFGVIDKVGIRYQMQIYEFEDEFKYLPEALKNKDKTDFIEFESLLIKNYAKEPDDKGSVKDWIEYYIYDHKEIIKKQAYKKSPFLVARFDLTQSAHGWGIGNGVRAIGNIESLQKLLIDFCNAIEEQFDPAVIVNQSLFDNGRLSFEAGAQNFASMIGNPLQNNAVINARTINFNYEGFFAALSEFRNMTMKMLDADIFLSISGAGKEMTAYETKLLEQEKLLRFGTLFQNITSELLTPLIYEYVEFYYYIFNTRKEQMIDIKYFGLLAQAQKEEELNKLMLGLNAVFQQANFNPEILDNIAFDKIPQGVFNALSLGSKYLKNQQDVNAVRQQRAQMQQQQMQMNQAAQMAQIQQMQARAQMESANE
jgi:hypothetical protein